MKEVIFVVSPKTKWRTFKLLQDKLVKDSGPVPEQGDKVLWQMIRDKQIYAWFTDEIPGDMALGVKLPKGKKIRVISSKK